MKNDKTPQEWETLLTGDIRQAFSDLADHSLNEPQHVKELFALEKLGLVRMAPVDAFGVLRWPITALGGEVYALLFTNILPSQVATQAERNFQKQRAEAEHDELGRLRRDAEAAHDKLDALGVPRSDGHKLSLLGRLDWLDYHLYGLDDVITAARDLPRLDRLKVVIDPEGR